MYSSRSASYRLTTNFASAKMLTPSYFQQGKLIKYLNFFALSSQMFLEGSIGENGKIFSVVTY